uniref:C-type lectin domain-containing protein n=1 Tax=Chrysemys picta bellii TaxID=8478 RepID=A0A8C3P9Z6_CHRPI
NADTLWKVSRAAARNIRPRRPRVAQRMLVMPRAQETELKAAAACRISCEVSGISVVGVSPVQNNQPLNDVFVSFPRPEGSGCKLCPRHWVPHRDKCYWLSEEDQYWSRGRDDCSRRRSHLLVIQDREELVKNVLNFTIFLFFSTSKPTDSDCLLHSFHRFTVSGPAEENSCAAVKKNQIKSEICITHYKWICQKEAVRI